ncbi:MAG: GDSL family lipase, partial [Calditrichaeota bacterium]|nr:GDSL family lipase [Calditrichota bacterium]
MIFQENQTIVFAGDSITDVNRRELPCWSIGQGYAMIAASLLLAKFPERTLRFHNRGVGGDTIRELDA